MIRRARPGGRGPRRGLAAAALGLAAAACGADATLDGVWEVDFGSTRGALRLERGRVYAHCYGDHRVGDYSLDGDAVSLHLRLGDGPPLELSGRLRWHGRVGLSLYPEQPRGVRLHFVPYTGDCSEVEHAG